MEDIQKNKRPASSILNKALNKANLRNAKIGVLCRNYEEMNETGKKKLRKVSEKILEIWNTVSKNSGSNIIS